MKILKKLLMIILGGVFFLGLVTLAKPASASIPPPASRAWMWLLNQNQGKMVKVTVSWKEGGVDKNVELKTVLRNVK